MNASQRRAKPRARFAATLARALGVLALLWTACAAADGIARLDQFVNATHTARGEFEQQIRDGNGVLTQRSSGTLMFSRPGKFRWAYVKPYPQLIVGDGTRVWIYDEDLQQVTVRKLGQALGSTPAALLAGSSDALKAFELHDEGTQDGLEWVLAVPRAKDSSFARIRIGFHGADLAAMELHDTFGQTTLLRFSALERNPRLDPAQFTFTPPAGADVIGAP